MKRCPSCDTGEHNLKIVGDLFTCYNCDKSGPYEELVETGILVRDATLDEIKEAQEANTNAFYVIDTLTETLYERVHELLGPEMDETKVRVQRHQHHVYIRFNVYDIWVDHKYIGGIIL